MSIYKCNPEWPVCLYDFTFKNRNPNFFSYKVKRDFSAYLRPDYYPADAKPCEAQKEKPDWAENGLENSDSELLVVRNQHLCVCHPKFETRF